MLLASLRAATRCTPQCTRVLRGRFRGRVHTRYPSGVIVIARPAVARVRSIVGAPLVHSVHCTHTHIYTHAHTYVREYSCVDVGGTGIFPRPAQILLRAGINLLPAFRSRSLTFRALRRKGRKVEIQRVDLLDVRSRDISDGRYNEIYMRCPGDNSRPCLCEHYARGTSRHREKLSREDVARKCTPHANSFW